MTPLSVGRRCSISNAVFCLINISDDELDLAAQGRSECLELRYVGFAWPLSSVENIVNRAVSYRVLISGWCRGVVRSYVTSPGARDQRGRLQVIAYPFSR